MLGPGFGQAALRRPLRGIAWLVAIILSALGTAFTFWAGPLVPLLAVVGIVDAFVLGYRTQAVPPLRWFHWTTLGMLVVSVCGLLFVRAFVAEAFKIPSTSMHPTLQLGDHIFISKLASHERGDMIAFRYPCDPARDYVKRIIAKGGDTVEVRCNVVYLNGTALPEKLVASECSYDDFDDRERRWFERRCSRYQETLDHSYEVVHDPERPQRDQRKTSGDQRDFPFRFDPQPPSCSHAGALESSETLGAIVETAAEDTAPACSPQLHYVVPPNHLFVLGDNRNNSNDSRVWGAVPQSYVKGKVIGIWLTGDRSTTTIGPVE